MEGTGNILSQIEELKTVALDFLCSVSVFKRVECFLVVGMSGSDCTDHDGRRVTTERLLEHASQGTVTVGDVRSCLGFSS